MHTTQNHRRTPTRRGRTPWIGLALGLALALAGCEGESDNPEVAREQVLEMAALPDDVQVPLGAVPASMPARSAVRFLSQASFGANEAEMAQVQADWRWGWLQKQFALPLAQTHWDRVKARQAIWVSLGTTEAPRLITNAPATLFDNAIWESYFTAPDQLRKRVAYALSQIMVTSLDGFNANGRYTALMGAGYMDVLERHAFGNFRDLLQDVTLNPAMGYYLSMRGNRKTEVDKAGNVLRVPDENYAREVMQLFTIGLQQLNPDGTPKLVDGKPVETYTQADVAGLAKVFTGWDLDTPATDDEGERYRRPMKLIAARHETGAKSFLGTSIAADTSADAGKNDLKMALDTLFTHPNVGPFIGKQLIQRLVTSNPSPGYVARVAARFNDNGQGVRGDMKAVIDAVLRDNEAMTPLGIANPAADWGKLREPVLRLTQMGRALNIKAPEGTLWGFGNLSNPATQLGQSPLRSPSVFNFYRPGYVPPNSQLSANGLVGPEFQIATDTSVPGYVNAMQGFLNKPPTGVTLDMSKELALVADPAALLARIDLMLTNQAMSPPTRSLILQTISALPATTDTQKLNRVRIALLMTLAAPEFITQK